MSEYATSLVERVAPLPDAVDIDRFMQLSDHGLSVVQGLSIPLAEQLVERSKEDAVAKFCPNDAKKRFASLDAIEAWQAKGRLVLPLVKVAAIDEELTLEARLMGLGWMGPGAPGEDEPEIPGAKTTFAIRIYDGASGQGNALPYTRAILDAHHAQFGSAGVWLEAWGDNIAALRTYERAGFMQAANVPGERDGQEQRRVYMTLGQLAT